MPDGRACEPRGWGAVWKVSKMKLGKVFSRITGIVLAGVFATTFIAPATADSYHTTPTPTRAQCLALTNNEMNDLRSQGFSPYVDSRNHCVKTSAGYRSIIEY